MAASTNAALARRAAKAAELIDYFVSELRREMKEQNIYLTVTGENHGRTVTLKMGPLNNHLLHLMEISQEIRKFKAPKRAN